MQVKYRIYPSLLDSFHYFKQSEDEGAGQELLNKINRVETPKSKAMLRGIEFERVVNQALDGHHPIGDIFKTLTSGGLPSNDTVQILDKKVQKSLIMEYVDILHGASKQVFLSTTIHTAYGLVEVYGIVDYLKINRLYDCKTTARYNFPKYLSSYQWPTYLEAVREYGIKNLVFLATDFRSVYKEEYVYSPQCKERLVSGCNEFVDFLEANRDKITDKKIFNQEG